MQQKQSLHLTVKNVVIIIKVCALGEKKGFKGVI
jgi:hypothetical protein